MQAPSAPVLRARFRIPAAPQDCHLERHGSGTAPVRNHRTSQLDAGAGTTPGQRLGAQAHTFALRGKQPEGHHACTSPREGGRENKTSVWAQGGTLSQNGSVHYACVLQTIYTHIPIVICKCIERRDERRRVASNRINKYRSPPRACRTLGSIAYKSEFYWATPC